jgi:CO/xanthine dehydrogenase Mo-binding subunit
MAFEQEDGSEVYGTIAYDPTDDRFLLFTVDTSTLPANTLSPVLAVIDPLQSGPGAGLIPAAIGQRYLLTEATGTYTGPSAAAWESADFQPLVANANDIVEYDGTRWVVSFDSQSSPVNTQYVTNITTTLQYRWTGDSWVKSYQGLYPGGQWTLIL